MASQLNTIDFSSLIESELAVFLKENKIALTPGEARDVQELLGRGPTLTEAIMIGIQCSEHCSYRSSRDHLKKLPTDAPNVILGPCEDSGIIEIARNSKGEKYGAVIAHESHNSPSQIVPYEGAATGVGGIMRDIVCMGARAIASLDPLRFGPTDNKKSMRIADEVISGIAGYGNPLGVANIGGDVYFHDSFAGNCLVNVVGVGVLKEDEIIHSFAPKNADGYDIIVVGKPTDNSGFGGASFSSADIDESEKDANKGAVQEPNPFLEQHILEASYELFKIIKDKGMIDRVGFKDMGAGGIMCASIELAEGGGYGASLDLEKVIVGMENLHPSVIACSETQERFCWVCPPEFSEIILEHYNTKWDLPSVSHNAGASIVGKINTSENYTIKYQGELLCDAPCHVLTKGLKFKRESQKPVKTFDPVIQPQVDNHKAMILDILAHADVCSRRSIYNRYDKHVQGLTVLEAGVADAGVIAPFLNRTDMEPQIQNTGIAISTDSNPRYCEIDPRIGTELTVLETLRNVAAVGATPACLTDCLNFGNPEKPTSFWEFSESIDGLAHAANTLGLKDFTDEPIPYISGNVSFYNESRGGGGGKVAPSPIVACLGTLVDAYSAIDMKLKSADSLIYLVGGRQEAFGGSVLNTLLKKNTNDLPAPKLKVAREEIFAVIDAIQKETVTACHDISDGGVVTAIAEMMMGGWADGEVGVQIDISTLGVSIESALYGEASGFICEVPLSEKENFEKILGDLAVQIGHTTIGQFFVVDGVCEVSLDDMKQTWTGGLDGIL